MEKEKKELETIHFDRIVKDNVEHLKDKMSGSTNVDNWKIAVLFGLGFIHPVYPYTFALMYVMFKVMTGNILDIREGRHYETKTIYYREAEEDSNGRE